MSVEGFVSIPAPIEAVARALDRHPAYRVLRRLEDFSREEAHGLRTATMTGVVLDVETTGLDHREDRIIELAMRSFGVDEKGRIVEAGRREAYLEDPGVPITEEITRVTGLKQDDLKGKMIRDVEAASMILNADFVISHNAGFDRPFVDARLPEVAGRPWCCSLKDVDWKKWGFDGRTQSQLIAAIGGFYDAHRASVDVNALLHLLDHELPDGRTVIAHALDTARRPTFRIEAAGTPRSASEALKARGWRWRPDRRVWGIDVDERRRDEEVDWATIRVYAATDAPSVAQIDWTMRYAG